MNRNMYAKAKMCSWLFIILAIVGLLFMPLFPWITATNGDTTTYSTEAMIHTSAKPYLEIWSGFGIAKQYDTLGIIEMPVLTPQISALMGLSRSLSLISTSFWACLFFGMFILLGLAVYKFEKRYESLSHLLLLVGCSSLLPATLVIVGHVQFYFHLFSLAAETSSTSVESSLVFSYNYIPLILGVILLLVTVLYIKKTFVPSLNYFKHRPKTK